MLVGSVVKGITQLLVTRDTLKAVDVQHVSLLVRMKPTRSDVGSTRWIQGCLRGHQGEVYF